MHQLSSLSELTNALKKNNKIYLLIYKKGSETSECAFKNISNAIEDKQDIFVFFTDVSSTRDIHTQYNITSAPALLKFERETLKNQIKGCHDAQFYKSFFEETVFTLNGEHAKIIQKRVTVFSTPTCSWCNTLKNYLKDHKIQFTDIDVSKDKKAADELVKRSGQMGVPQTDIDGEIIVGFNKARINELLNI